MTVTIYGIKSCSTMKKAFTTLDTMGVAYDFHDYKKQGIDKDTLQVWVDRLGIEKVLNKRGTTWRKLTDEEKEEANNSVDYAIELLLQNTSMIKRPILESITDNGSDNKEGLLLCGFDENEFEALKH